MFEFGDYYYYFPHFCRLKNLQNRLFLAFNFASKKNAASEVLVVVELNTKSEKGYARLVEKLYNPLFFPTTTHL
jgi:hypothetical protein